MRLSTVQRLGLSIIEIIVGVSLVALVLLLMISVIPTANFSLHRATEIESVDTYAQEVVEYTKASLASEAEVSPLPTTGCGCTTTACVPLNNMVYHMSKNVKVVDCCKNSCADNYFVFEINVNLYKTDGQSVIGSPVQVVGRQMVRVSKAAVCCCP